MAAKTTQARMGKKLVPGDCFLTTTKRMNTRKHSVTIYGVNHANFKVLRNGETSFFTKGKRRYYCEVVQLAKTETGFNIWSFGISSKSYQTGPRWYRFTYFVRVIKN